MRRYLPDIARRIGIESAQALRRNAAQGKETTMNTYSWVKDAAERAVKTFCQALLSVLTLDGANVLSLDWGQTLSVGGTAALVSVLTSVVSMPLGDKGTASAVSNGEAA